MQNDARERLAVGDCTRHALHQTVVALSGQEVKQKQADSGCPKMTAVSACLAQ